MSPYYLIVHYANKSRGFPPFSELYSTEVIIYRLLSQLDLLIVFIQKSYFRLCHFDNKNS